ncbi:MAG: hypothetical protein IKF01_04075 [Bacilli bacterium]|nr:hypothetical protein [Bacilli bacterium]
MKEAAGEANLTVVAIILIGVVVAVATPLIGTLTNNTADRACCMDSGGTWDGGKCNNAGTSYQQCKQDAQNKSGKSGN